MNASMGFLHHLRALGATKAEEFLAAHFGAIGQQSSTDVMEKFL
jgi:hypothetical protein